MAPIVRGRKGEFKDLLDQLDQQGFRARVDGEMMDLSEPLLLDRRKNHTIEAIVDRILLKAEPTLEPERRRPLRPASCRKPSAEKRLEQAVAKALQLANGLVLVAVAAAARSSCSPPPWPALTAASTCPSWSRAASASTPPSAPARSATAWARSTISTPPRSSPTGQSRCWTAAWARLVVAVPAQAHSSGRRPLQNRPQDALRGAARRASSICWFTDRPKARRRARASTAFWLPARQPSKKRAATAIAST